MRLKWVIIAGVVLVALVALLPRKTMFPPEDIVGLWTTTAPKYRDRFFKITRVAVIFGTGEDSVDVYFISSVEKSCENNGTLYTIHYRNRRDLDGKLSFYWGSEKGGVLRLKNQKQIVWRKTKALR